MVLEKLKKKREPVYYFFSGKGGVGKTSIAAATALWFSEQKKKVLIISTDPAHSLGDSYNVPIGGSIKKLRKNLFAVEIDPAKAMEEYKEKFMPKIENIEQFKGLGIEEAFDVAGMTPGIDEVAAFDKFLQYMHSREYDVIIFDTAPTGHALRFLSFPEVLDSWVGRIIKIRLKFSGVVNIIKKVLPFGKEEGKPQLGTEQLENLKTRIEEAREVLSNPEKTNYNIVTIPQQMAIVESERALKTLKEYRIPVKSIVINQIIPPNQKCSFCTIKRNEQLERVETIKKKFAGLEIFEVPLFEKEIGGFTALSKLGKKMYG